MRAKRQQTRIGGQETVLLTAVCQTLRSAAHHLQRTRLDCAAVQQRFPCESKDEVAANLATRIGIAGRKVDECSTASDGGSSGLGGVIDDASLSGRSSHG